MRKRYIVLSVLLAAASSSQAQQDMQFSQYVFNGLILNPAYAGYKTDLYMNSTYRQQWSGMPGSPQTAFISLDAVVRPRDEKIGLGGFVSWDRLGAQESISAKGIYSYRIPLDHTGTRRLCLGIGVSVTQYSLDGTALLYVDPNDPVLPSVKVSTIVPDADFGVYYYTPNFYAGISALDLFALNHEREIYYSGGNSATTFQKSPHLYLTMGTVISLSDNVKIKPSFLVKEDLKGPTTVDLNTMLLLGEKIWFGGSYRFGVNAGNKESYQPGLESSAGGSIMTELFVTSRMRIGYAYDFPAGEMAGYQSGTHEFSIGLLFSGKKKNETLTSPRYF
jgi:type IX secretion system PorP/SprF family membrane protein